jgi:hypothetical protein
MQLTWKFQGREMLSSFCGELGALRFVLDREPNLKKPDFLGLSVSWEACFAGSEVETSEMVDWLASEGVPLLVYVEESEGDVAPGESGDVASESRERFGSWYGSLGGGGGGDFVSLNLNTRREEKREFEEEDEDFEAMKEGGRRRRSRDARGGFTSSRRCLQLIQS